MIDTFDHGVLFEGAVIIPGQVQFNCSPAWQSAAPMLRLAAAANGVTGYIHRMTTIHAVAQDGWPVLWFGEGVQHQLLDRLVQRQAPS